MRFEREITTHDLCQEMLPLFQLHYQEIAHFQDIPLDPDFDQYVQMERAGFVRTYTARDDERKLVGYAVFFVRKNLHYKNSLQALQDILFIHPDRRGFGVRFIIWCDRMLRMEGVQAVYHHVKEKHNFGPMLERLGYQLVDLIYTRRLDQWQPPQPSLPQRQPLPEPLTT
jgi:GNAT superfamily N-acetyltransferase